jgi:general secretion pathway protein M
MMNARIATLQSYVTRHPPVAAGAYVAALVASLGIIWFSLAEMSARRQEIGQLSETLAQLEGRRPIKRDEVRAPQLRPEGSPFLEGPTITVASAALLQRLADAILRAGGSMLSSQVELEGVNSKDGFVTVVATSELEERNLQALLYDLEAGMPFVFIDQMAAQLTGTAGNQRMRLQLSVSAQWQASK